ncbi:uncharacterized protein SPPG_06158 [Spizellomyces punctatus DAOM BR117]|uniref:Probable 26S proteasome regulatory subunit p27 n=1 Tax=Spizellomyces punctatus (strain DAOM BR117) TaxID=645134 RepID=A0A0L0HCG3_SPIPD|nr:uncharacterized protein SPPG_06158 [Spizellomyces punctatus DAOM BR117]KNC98458.1 hypothetical protein SPPG_06158 [Spizellomyces punctatus DAOM BR117]|eukprot:XP_016606498.1 hypothetical protein SPPG_06158 [Spizellomyces punctatus DAOM BR117]
MTAPTHAELVAKAQRLVREKDALEAHIRELEQVLQSQGVGMDDPLTDAAGFPRADIDVYQIRHARVEIIRKKNDLKAIMKDIEQALHDVHAQAKLEPTVTAAETRERTTINDDNLKPFALVNGVAPDSPADEAGMKRNDLILRFGTVDATHREGLKRLSDLVAGSENKPIDILVRRDGTVTALTVTPHKWSGRGLLGCHLVPS